MIEKSGQEAWLLQREMVVSTGLNVFFSTKETPRFLHKKNINLFSNVAT